MASNPTEPDMFAPPPFASGVPTVRWGEDCDGGWHEGESRPGPWTRFGDVHSLNAVTSEAFSGVAPRGCSSFPLLCQRRLWPILPGP